MKKIISKKISIFICILIILPGIFAFVPLQKEQIVPVPQQTALHGNPVKEPAAKIIPDEKVSKNDPVTKSIVLKIGGTNMKLPIVFGQTLYQTMLAAEKSGAISFAGKDYSGLGFFMTDIGDLYQGNGKFLVYYINGTEASVGVSSYFPNDGDVIEWKLQ